MLKIKECKALARRTLLGRYGTVIGAYFITIAIKVLMWALTGICGVMTVLYAGVLGGFMGTGVAFSFPKLVGGVMLTMFMLAATVIVSLWFEIGSTKLMLNICRGVKYGVGDVFYGFKDGSNALNYLLVGVVLGLITIGLGLAQRILYTIAGRIWPGQSGAHIAASIIISVIMLLVTWYIATAFMFAKIIIADKRESGVGAALKASRRLMKGRKLKGFWLMYLSFIFWYILMFACGPAALWVSPYIVCTTVIFYMDADGSLWQLPDGDGAQGRGPETVSFGTESSSFESKDVQDAGSPDSHEAFESTNVQETDVQAGSGMNIESQEVGSQSVDTEAQPEEATAAAAEPEPTSPEQATEAEPVTSEPAATEPDTTSELEISTEPTVPNEDAATTASPSDTNAADTFAAETAAQSADEPSCSEDTEA